MKHAKVTPLISHQKSHDPSSALCPELLALIECVHRVTDDRILRLPQVSQKTGRAHSTIWKDVSEGIFPPPISTGKRSVGWRESELSAWISAWSFASRSKQQIDIKAFISLMIKP